MIEKDGPIGCIKVGRLPWSRSFCTFGPRSGQTLPPPSLFTQTNMQSLLKLLSRNMYLFVLVVVFLLPGLV